MDLPKINLKSGRQLGNPIKVIKTSPVVLRSRNAAQDSSAESFAPSESTPLKLHHQLAGMK